MKDILKYKKIVEENADLIEAKEEEIYNATRQWLMLDFGDTQTQKNLDALSAQAQMEMAEAEAMFDISNAEHRRSITLEELDARNLQRYREERDRAAQARLHEEAITRYTTVTFPPRLSRWDRFLIWIGKL